jgi:hypothetical protein
MVCGHVAVHRTARDGASDCASRGADKTVTKKTVADHGARHAADHGASRSRRPAADFVSILGTPVIMMAVTRRRIRRKCCRRDGGNCKSCSSSKLWNGTHGLDPSVSGDQRLWRKHVSLGKQVTPTRFSQETWSGCRIRKGELM